MIEKIKVEQQAYEWKVKGMQKYYPDDFYQAIEEERRK